jgi:hypothetical protein
LTSPVGAAIPPPEPHSSCLSEPERLSLEGQAEAQLTVVNNTDAVFELYWLDYDGERVYYQDSQPHSVQIQDTWLTHPWILTDPGGTCYLLIVMTSLAQTMTIGSTTGEPPVTPVDTTTVPATTSPDPITTEPPPVAVSSIPAAQEETDPGFPTPLVIAALAMMGVLVGVLYGKGVFGPRKPPKSGGG